MISMLHLSIELEIQFTLSIPQSLNYISISNVSIVYYLQEKVLHVSC